ncbi:BTAD domain-containing putative transcriptional regulator [Mesorhizobium sp. WSM4976]|uniref:BTAD domain-containing putative transcriptional regulator n=1 Tax=Mesorhizobium sp. WSM4976 TaxID=3038549 RepID=UPI0024161F6D|nr:BTAD domain-containing putative transcriptional regulator [Mesorhizobium sp. WSM4976]MDG4892393.1 BTAD domain-containing putative transcriptional regulator [Mesorhizobium sp. WSM4976]
MAKIRISTFGGLQVFSREGRQITITSRKAQALLVYLAMTEGRRQSRDKLAALLWEDRGEVQARASLRQELLVLRKVLGLNGPEIVGEGDGIVLAPDCIDVDALRFQRLMTARTPQAHEEAAALYHGPFMEAFNLKAQAFENWVAVMRQHLNEMAVKALTALLSDNLASGSWARALELMLRLLPLDPLQESVHRALMQLYVRQGRIGAALRQFHVCREILQREIGVRPEPETEQLYQDIQQRRREHARSGPVGLGESARSPNTQPLIPGGNSAGPEPAESGSELRQLVVMFVEMGDPSVLADEDDPERQRDLSTRFADVVRSSVMDHGGVVDRQLGGTTIAVFGLAVAHSNDAERALRAGLEILRVVRATQDRFPAARIGLASGRMLVTRLDQGGADTATITGSAMHVAGVLAGAADADELLLSDAVYQSVAHLVEHAEPRTIVARVSEKPIEAWRSVGLSSDGVARTAFVGRHAELAQLAGALKTCLDTGRGLVVHVRGEAGIGKTRLVEEFQRLAAEQGFECHTGLVLDFGAGGKRNAIRALVRGLVEDAPIAVDSGLVDAALEVHLHQLLQLPLPADELSAYDAIDNAARAKGLEQTLLQLVERAAARRPLVMIVEDIQWADAETLALVDALATAARGSPVLVVTTARSEEELPEPGRHIGAGEGPRLTLDLPPLYRQEALTLAGRFLAPTDVFAISCVERAGGNPLFLEQLLRSGDRGPDRLPDTIHSVVLARLDMLPPGDRHILRAASVLGQLFAPDALVYLLGDSGRDYGSLIRRGFLKPVGNDLLFAHALMRDGVYLSLPRAERLALHRRAAQWFIERDPILRAEHLERAEDKAAPRAFLDAANHENRAYRYDKALALAERGLQLVGDGGTRSALLCCRGDILLSLGRTGEAGSSYSEALAAANDEGERCRALLGVAAVKRIADDVDGAIADVQAVEGIAAGSGLGEEAARAHFLHGNLLFPGGDIGGCLTQHRRSLEIARQAGLAEIEAASLGGIGDALYMCGQMVSAHRQYRSCVEMAERNGFGRIALANRSMVVATSLYIGDIKTLLSEAQAAIEVSRKILHQRAELIAHMNAYIAWSSLMEFDKAMESAEASLHLARQIRAPRFEAEALAFRGDVHRLVGRRREAIADLEEALRMSRQTGMAYLGPWYLGLMAVATDDPTARAAALKEGEALLATNRVGHNHLQFRRYAIDACLACDDGEGACHHADSLDAFTQAEPLPWASFFSARGRALAAAGTGRLSPSLRKELQGLSEEARRRGFIKEGQAIEAALAARTSA